MLRKSNQVIFALLLFLSSCGVTLPGGSSSGSGNIGSVPIYQGMTVSALSNTSNVQSPKNQNDINQENPFNLPNNEKLESKIESDLAEFMMEESLDYYARPSETVRITINILNPQSYVILSFNLNGRRYQSFEFREGSTSTRLLMDVALQNLPGVQSLTIDEIKYIVDSSGDNQIRDVVMFGDQTVEVGIGYNQLPTVNLVSQSILPTTVTYSLDVSDSLNILSTQETAVYFYFFDGETIQKEELVVGNNEVEFNKLTSKTLYQYAVVSALNPMDGEGPVLTYHDVEAFFTSNFIQLLVNTTKESISFEVSVLNGLESGAVNRVDLEKNSEIIATQESSSGSFSELLSNNEYALSVYYDYSHEGESEVLTEVYSLAASTLAKSTPTFSFTDVVAGKEDVTFEYEVTDLDEVGSLSKIELLKGVEVIETLTEFEDTSFANLLSNNDYQLKATYTYDLNDGVGEQFLVFELNSKTLAMSNPTFTFTDVNPGKDDIIFEYEVIDEDEVGSLTKIELIKLGEVVETLSDFEDTSFTELLSNNEYTLKATYTYDLNDGIGNSSLIVISETKTDFKLPPEFDESLIILSKTSIDLQSFIIDIDNTGLIKTLKIYKDEVMISDISDSNTFSFINLEKNTSYRIYVEYEYDLNEGDTKKIVSFDKLIKTKFFNIGSGTDVDPYVIKTVEDLSDIKFDLTAVYILANDLNLEGINWTPIGQDFYSPFSGKFDGQGFTINNLTINGTHNLAGLFGWSSDGSITNFNLINVDIDVTGKIDEDIYVGSFIAYNSGFIENLHALSGKIIGRKRADKHGYFGGLVGIHSTGFLYQNTVFNDFSNYLDVTGVGTTNSSTGGIFGQIINNTSIDNSFNYGLISGENNVGGLVGFTTETQYPGDGARLTISNSENNGAITGLANVGGLLGNSPWGGSVTINNSSNFAAITAGSSSGGLVGFAYSSIFRDSENYGEIKGSVGTGGILGYGQNGGTSITNSNNFGSISGGRILGGLIGGGGIITINNSSNEGSITGSDEIGGLAGGISSLTLNKSFNSSIIIGTYSVGGFAGKVYGNATLNNSFNIGSVEGLDFVGGFIGRIQGNTTITNLFNSGLIKGSSYVAGFIGRTLGEFYGFSSINLSDIIVETSTSNVGSIVGGFIAVLDYELIYNSGVVYYNEAEISGYNFGYSEILLDIIDEDFFVNTLEWSPTIWDFSTLNIVGSFYPKLI